MQTLLADADYVASRELSVAVHLAVSLQRPLLLEGEAGVGKTELANVLAQRLGRVLLRLQCYEGIDMASAGYEWNYAQQLLSIRLAEARQNVDGAEASLFDEKHLIARPLLNSLRPQPGGAPVLLIDEVDRADEPFEAFLLELLSDYQITIPELGTVKAETPPIVVVTSNRTRDVHDALRRRCFYHWVDYPREADELDIVRRRAPETPDAIRVHLVRFVQHLRTLDLYKRPGVAEAIDWARTLNALGAIALDEAVVDDTLGVLLKYQDDLAFVRREGVAPLLTESKPI